MRRFPAPWYVDGYIAVFDGKSIYSVKAADHELVVSCHRDWSLAKAIVASRNEGTVAEDVESVQNRFQAALDAAHKTTEQMREHFRQENEMLLRTLRNYEDKIKTLQSLAASQPEREHRRDST